MLPLDEISIDCQVPIVDGTVTSQIGEPLLNEPEIVGEPDELETELGIADDAEVNVNEEFE